MHAVIAAQCASFQTSALAIGGTDDHVHVLARFHVTTDLVALVRAMKGESSHEARRSMDAEWPGWQGGYGIVSVGRRHVNVVANYIRSQRERHRTHRLVAALEITEHQRSDDGFDDE